MSISPYYLVVDLEATCDNAGAVPRDETETIEIGAVLVDGITMQQVDEFQTFVRPVVHRQLTPFCTELTTITQADVDPAPLFPVAAARLTAFARDAVFCSWGAYDKHQLARDAQRHGVEHPLPGRHINVKELFARAVGSRRSMGAARALAHLGLALAGTHHRGIDDARNIARMLPYALGRALPDLGGPNAGHDPRRGGTTEAWRTRSSASRTSARRTRAATRR